MFSTLIDFYWAGFFAVPFLKWWNTILKYEAKPQIHCKSKIFVPSYNNNIKLKLPALTRKWNKVKE